MLDRCAEIINAAEISYHTKEQLWRVLTAEFPNAHKRIWRLGHDCTDRENRGVLKALKEMLTLTQEEYPR
jgi:predicted metal-dependent hydrolase